jgi:RNA polymerase sigma factor (TIGR02999 family)
MADPDTAPVTRLLRRWSAGDRSCEEELFGAVYDELVRIAERQMRAERPGHTLDPPGLVSEAYLRLCAADQDYADRVHFFAVAARVMRRFLIDHARARDADKRGGRQHAVTLRTDLQAADDPPVDAARLEKAIAKLERLDARKAEFFRLRHLAGMSTDEIAAHANASARTVRRELQFVRAFVRRELAL